MTSPQVVSQYRKLVQKVFPLPNGVGKYSDRQMLVFLVSCTVRMLGRSIKGAGTRCVQSRYCTS